MGQSRTLLSEASPGIFSIIKNGTLTQINYEESLKDFNIIIAAYVDSIWKAVHQINVTAGINVTISKSENLIRMGQLPRNCIASFDIKPLNRATILNVDINGPFVPQGSSKGDES